MNLKELRAFLSDLGVDPSTVQPLDRDPSIITAVVPGGNAAVATWAKLRDALDRTGRWPIICGKADKALGYFADQFELISSLEDELASVPSGSVKEVVAESQGRERAAMKAQFLEMKAKGEDVPDFLLNPDEADEIGSDLNRAHELEPWPASPSDSSMGAHSTFDARTNKPFERCLITLLPTPRPEESPAYLRFGGYNSCPPPRAHVAVMRDWSRRFGAVPMCITSDVIECEVARPPQTPADARSLAVEQEAYCGDIVSQGTESVERLAREIWRSKRWFFWWD